VGGLKNITITNRRIGVKVFPLLNSNERRFSLAIDLDNGSETIAGMYTMAIYKRGRVHNFAAFGLQAQ